MSQPLFNRRNALLLGGSALAACAAKPSAMAQGQAAGTGWRTGPSLPMPVQEIYACLHNGRIHVAGGFVAEEGSITGPTRAHFALDPAADEWTAEPALPVARHHPQMVSLGGELYCIGGFEAHAAGTWQMKRDVWRLDAEAGEWVAAPELPAPNGESVATVVRDRLHLIGGRQPADASNLAWNDHTDTGAHWVFDGTAWTDGAPMPTPRNSAAAGNIDDRLHVVGGRTVAGGNTRVHECYDRWSDRWERLAPMPQAQAGLASGVIGNTLYAFGGEYFENGGGVFPEAWAYNSLEDRWRAIDDMPSPRHGLAGVTAGNDIYLIGGALERGGSQTSAAVEIYRA